MHPTTYLSGMQVTEPPPGDMVMVTHRFCRVCRAVPLALAGVGVAILCSTAFVVTLLTVAPIEYIAYGTDVAIQTCRAPLDHLALDLLLNTWPNPHHQRESPP